MNPSQPDAQPPWHTLESQIIHQNPWYAIRQDKVRTHTGAKITYTFMDHPGVVAVVPVTTEGQVVLIRQYRYTVKDWCWEIPMGGRDSSDSVAVARKELLEEIGGKSREIRHITNFYSSNGTCNIHSELFLATGVELSQNQPEATELIEIILKSKEEVMRMARAGEISDGESALAIFLCEAHW